MVAPKESAPRFSLEVFNSRVLQLIFCAILVMASVVLFIIVRNLETSVAIMSLSLFMAIFGFLIGIFTSKIRELKEKER